MRQQAADRAATGVGIVDPVPLDDVSPGLIEGRLIVSGIGARLLHGLHEEGAGVLATGE